MRSALFDSFFSGIELRHLLRAVRDSLMEDGPDLTTNAVFGPEDRLDATIVAKEATLLAGSPIIAIVLEETSVIEPGEWTLSLPAKEGDILTPGMVAAEISGSARVILRAERIILNFLCHMSGIANLTAKYVKELEGTGVRLLDTRKTLPGLRYPEKYAVLVGGGCNHRKTLGELLMLKDNHVDAAGGIQRAVECLRQAYDPAPPIEVECRMLAEVDQAVAAGVSRIMLDNMDVKTMALALAKIPESIEVEISGGVSLDALNALASVRAAPVDGKPGRGVDFISVGKLTHSAPYADFSMRIRLGQDS